MKKIFFTILLTFGSGFLFSGFSRNIPVKIGTTNPNTNAYVFGTGEQLSGQQFQTDGILTYKGYQYTVYYNTSRNVCIARRKMPVGTWEELTLPYKNSADDAHNVIVMGICHNDGTIHLSYDHHNDPLHYCYSIKGSANEPENMPWEAASFSATTNIMDTAVPDVTYPRFISKPDGNLLFECRFHYSGYGDSYLREYDAETKKWTLIGRYVQGMDVTASNPVVVNGSTLYSEDACAYINGMTYDNDGKLHVTWVWRDDFGGQSNHDFYYAYSADDGRTWKNTHNEQVATTQLMQPVIDRNSGGCLSQHMRDKIMVEEIVKNRGLINQETQAVDSKGRIHAINSHIPDGQGTDSNWATSRTKARLHHRFRKADGSWGKKLITCDGVSINSTRRVSLAFDSFDNAYIVANGAGVFTASPDDEYANWTKISDDGKTGQYSEPLIDRPLLKENGILSFVYLSADKKITVFDYLAKNPNTPTGNGLLAEYFSNEDFTGLISSETVATPNQSTIPAGTQSIRWSGTFETLLGEEYTLYLNTSGETSVYINSRQALFANPSTAEESSFKYTLIPSHKNNLVIEAKTSEAVSLSWSSANTTKELIPATSLYPEKTNGEPGEITPPVLPGKVALSNMLDENKSVNGSGKNVLSIQPFDPPGEYSLEIKTKINSVEGRGLDIESVSKTGKGFRVSLDKTSINWTSPLTAQEQIAFANNAQEQIYRFAVAGDKVHIYRGKTFIGTKEIDYINKIQTNDTESSSAGTYGADIIGAWAGANNTGTGAPSAYGWDCTVSAPWNTAGSGSGVRFLDNQGHSYNGTAYNGRLMTIRWDADELLPAYYSYPVTLEGNTAYEFSMLYEYWANVSAGVTITVGISTTKDASGLLESQTFTTGAQNVLQKGAFSFASREAGQYYLIFSGGARAMYGIGGLSLKSISYEPRLLVGKNYVSGSLDAEIFYVSYEEGAFAAAEKDTEIETPELETKAALPTLLQTATTIDAANGTKKVYNLDFAPLNDYSIEVSAKILSANGRGLDIEARDGSGTGFRTSMDTEVFRYQAPFDNSLASISRSDNTETQLIRYAVQGGKVHIYQNCEYLKTYDLTAIGNMNTAGTEELPAAKEIAVNDPKNLISNGDFALDAHGAAPTGWTAEKTMGGGTQSRVQQKESTTELSNYPDGTKAFVFRFDNDESYGTWYSYPVMLEPNTWYEYSFDIIAWGTNTGKTFNVLVSTSENGQSGIICQETITTPGAGKEISRKLLRFKTAEGNTAVQYYLTFAKTASVGSIGSTNFTLVQNSINNLLFGKNYTEGNAEIVIDYITVDYSGAFAPEKISNSTSNVPENSDISVYSMENILNVKSEKQITALYIYDVLGKCHFSCNPNSNLFTTQLLSGIYMVRVNAGKDTFTGKAVIR